MRMMNEREDRGTEE